MKVHCVLLIASVLGLAGCDRGAEAQRLAAEREALERDKAQLAAERAEADRAATEQERARLDSERAALEVERAKLSNDREAQSKAEQNARVAAERAARLAAERRAADENAARQQAEVREREARLAGEKAVADVRAAQTVDFFYDALDPHGDWVEIEQYGYAFRPKLARDPGWRPYTEGGWIHTDYGWTWRSDEPFGWATYHYGRWTRVPRLGWVWIPGTEWGPAWVSWRRSDDYVGWAPLPPDAWSATGFNAAVDSYFDIGPASYVFVGVRDFAEPTYTGHVVAPDQNVTIINKTVNVTNVTYKTVNQQNVVVNNGPEITFVERQGGRAVQRATLERMAMKNSGDAQPAKLQGNVLRLAAPVLNSKAPTAKPKAVGEQVKVQETDRGWDQSNAEARKALREQAQREARRAERIQRGEPENDAPAAAAPARSEPVAPAPASVSDERRQPTRETPAATPRQRNPNATPPSPATGRERSGRRLSERDVAPGNAPRREAPETTRVPAATPTQTAASPAPALTSPRRPRRQTSPAAPAETEATPAPAPSTQLAPAPAGTIYAPTPKPAPAAAAAPAPVDALSTAPALPSATPEPARTRNLPRE